MIDWRCSWGCGIVTALALHLGMAAASPTYAQPTSCEPVVASRNEGVTIDRSGHYCLRQDVWIDDPSPLAWHGTGRPHVTVDIVHDDVDLDLDGHTIHAGAASPFVNIHASVEDLRTSPPKPPPQRVVIRNGRIDSVTQGAVFSGFWTAAVLSDLGDPLEGMSVSGLPELQLAQMIQYNQKLNAAMFDKELRRRPASTSDYLPRQIRLENLKIQAHGGNGSTGARDGAINIQGAGTVIRNCTIETDAGTAIWIFGPKSLIENNTIIVHGTNRQREADAPIRLIQGDGAVIRNNKFVFKDAANRRVISTFSTGPITVEDNTFYGLSNVDPIGQAFLGSLQMRARGNRIEPAWKAVFAGGF